MIHFMETGWTCATVTQFLNSISFANTVVMPSKSSAVSIALLSKCSLCKLWSIMSLTAYSLYRVQWLSLFLNHMKEEVHANQSLCLLFMFQLGTVGCLLCFVLSYHCRYSKKEATFKKLLWDFNLQSIIQYNTQLKAKLPPAGRKQQDVHIKNICQMLLGNRKKYRT